MTWPCETCGFSACVDRDACRESARFDIEAGIKKARTTHGKGKRGKGVLELAREIHEDFDQAFLCAVAADLLDKWALEDIP